MAPVEPGIHCVKHARGWGRGRGRGASFGGAYAPCSYAESINAEQMGTSEDGMSTYQVRHDGCTEAASSFSKLRLPSGSFANVALDELFG